MTGKDGSRVGDTYRLLTTLLDHQRYPATDLVALYHERWEIEIAFYEICHTIIDGHTLRSADQPGLEQEIWAMLVLYQLLRTAMIEAIESTTALAATGRLDPDRASFTVALETARDQVVLADEVLPDRADPLRLGAIETAVIAAPLPKRRPRRTITIELMETDPEKLWNGKEIAAHLNAPPRNILTQLAEWSRLGWLEHHGKGLYSLPTHRVMPLPTTAPA